MNKNNSILLEKHKDILSLNQITHPVREAFLVLSTAVASAAFFIYYKTHPKQRKTLRMTA